MFELAGAKHLTRIMTIDGLKTRVIFRVKWEDATAADRLARYMAASVKKHIPADLAQVQLTGTLYQNLSTVTAIISDLLRSFGIAFIVITMIMMLLMRNFRLGLVAMVPNLLPILLVGGAMGFLAVPLDLANLLIASIVIGIAVDDTIHFLHHFREAHQESQDVNAAIDFATHHAGRALVTTTIILAIGFSVYMLSQLTSLQRFGALIAVTVFVAVLVDLIFVPALLRVFYGKDGEAPKQGNAQET